jgi:hypothetical protein
MRSKTCIAVVLFLVISTQSANAWFDGGHMTVAYIAYKNLSPETRLRVDALLQLNPMYSTWTQDVSADQKGLVAFMHAATWPDCIKSSNCSPGYTSDGGDNPPGNATDTQNIGYNDHLMHKYWHFDDVPYSAGAPGKPPKHPNALSEIQLLSKAIRTGESDDIKSYDVVWLEHLVGDVHQPLHSTSRFTKNHPNGDAGGNDVAFCEKPCRDELHAYWDGLLGDRPSIQQVRKIGDTLLAKQKPAAAAESDPAIWVQESFELAKSAVYVSPISDDNDPANKISQRPDTDYEVNAKNVAQAQVLLAGYRLANLLNSNLK